MVNGGTSDQESYVVGVQHARIFAVWAAMRSADTFPFPWPSGHEPVRDQRFMDIVLAARYLIQIRTHWLTAPGSPDVDLTQRTLANLSSQRPAWLETVQTLLDQTMFAAYGWPQDLTDEQILERLLTLNLVRAAARTE